jgi:hypothetical protein
MKNKTRSKRGGASSTLHTKPYKSIKFDDEDVDNIIEQQDGVFPPPITLPPQNPNTTINFADNPGIFETDQFNIGDDVRIRANGIFDPRGEIIDINMNEFGQIINYTVEQPQQGPFDDEELVLRAHQIYLDPDVQQDLDTNVQRGGGIFDDVLKNCSDCLSWSKTGVIAGLGANSCKYCIPNKTRISNILDQIFYFDKVDITGGHMGNDGWSNSVLDGAIVSEFTIFTRNFRYFFGNFEDIEPFLNNTPHLERFYKLYKSLYLNQFLEEFKWKDDRIRREVYSDNIMGRKKDLFILNDKYTIKDKNTAINIIYDYEKQLNTQVLFFYTGTERYGDRDKWFTDTKNKIIEILSVDIFEKRYRQGVHQTYYNTHTVTEIYLHWFENAPDSLYDVARFSDYIGEFLNMNNNENESNNENVSDNEDDEYYHAGHESGQHPAFTGKETADKGIVRQGINEPSIASDIYAPNGMNQLRTRMKAYTMNREGGKRRKKTRRKKNKKKRKKTRRKKGKQKKRKGERKRKTRIKKGGVGNKINNKKISKKNIKSKNKIHKTRKKIIRQNQFDKINTLDFRPHYEYPTISSANKIRQ